MIDALSTPRNRIRTLVLLVLCGLLAISAAVIGIDDNLPGVLSAFLAGTALVLAFIHPWRTSAQFRRLLYASILGLVVSGVLSNMFERIAANVAGSNPLQEVLSGIGAVFFFIAILICPPGLIAGAIGSIIMSIRERRQASSGPTRAA